jgi:hypothetical protein
MHPTLVTPQATNICHLADLPDDLVTVRLGQVAARRQRPT